jgi:HlyD family secretion protein
VNANVSESDVGLIREGGPATFRVDAYPGRTFTGTISQIRYNPTTVESVVTYVTVIQVSNDDLALRPGMTANITFEVAKAEKVLRVPNSALRFTPVPPDPFMVAQGRRGPKTPTVYLLANGEPRKVEVLTGLSDGAYTELRGGDLKEGYAVITERSWQGRPYGRPDMSQSLRPPGRM